MITMISDQIKAQFVKELIKKNNRPDGRQFLEHRSISMQKNVFENCEGSAICHLGDTKVLAGVKIDLATPFPDRPNEGMLSVGCEFSPIAHPNFQAGPPGEASIELARVVDRGIRAANAIDLTKLKIADGKVLGVFIDLYILDHNGNLTDAAALAAMSAVKNALVPKIEQDGEVYKLNHEERKNKLPLGEDVVTCTFEKIGESIVLDANIDEENASSGRLTFGATTSGLICSAQKSGSAGFMLDEFDNILDLTLEKRKELLKLL
ncbi:MAG: exosome complex protein Rrp42 [Candidatus Micrarchaeota archaeon]|nr:exosome complex protein Rrp42 [Candidatus Micrarchaeota archaeon]